MGFDLLALGIFTFFYLTKHFIGWSFTETSDVVKGTVLALVIHPWVVYKCLCSKDLHLCSTEQCIRKHFLLPLSFFLLCNKPFSLPASPSCTWGSGGAQREVSKPGHLLYSSTMFSMGRSPSQSSGSVCACVCVVIIILRPIKCNNSLTLSNVSPCAATPSNKRHLNIKSSGMCLAVPPKQNLRITAVRTPLTATAMGLTLP